MCAWESARVWGERGCDCALVHTIHKHAIDLRLCVYFLCHSQRNYEQTNRLVIKHFSLALLISSPLPVLLFNKIVQRVSICMLRENCLLQFFFNAQPSDIPGFTCCVHYTVAHNSIRKMIQNQQQKNLMKHDAEQKWRECDEEQNERNGMLSIYIYRTTIKSMDLSVGNVSRHFCVFAKQILWICVHSRAKA